MPCRLAPEHKFPAGHEDGYAAAKWAHDNASTFGGDASQLAIGGDSAGASIAAAVCHMARRRGGPKIVLQVLIYPTLQPTAHYSKLLPSYIGGPPVNHMRLHACWQLDE